MERQRSGTHPLCAIPCLATHPRCPGAPRQPPQEAPTEPTSRTGFLLDAAPPGGVRQEPYKQEPGTDPPASTGATAGSRGGPQVRQQCWAPGGPLAPLPHPSSHELHSSRSASIRVQAPGPGCRWSPHAPSNPTFGRVTYPVTSCALSAHV